MRIRKTKQREAILQVLEREKHPLTLDEILLLGKEIVPELGLRTVYRNLEELKKEFRVLAVDYPGQPLRYELAAGEHRPHFICRTCNKVYVLPVGSPEVTYPIVPGFEIEGDEIIFYGRCSACEE